MLVANEGALQRNRCIEQQKGVSGGQETYVALPHLI